MSEECKKEPTEQVAAKWVVIALVAIAIGCLLYKVFDDTTIKFVPKNSSEWAAWVSGIATAGAVIVACLVYYRDSQWKKEKEIAELDLMSGTLPDSIKQFLILIDVRLNLLPQIIGLENTLLNSIANKEVYCDNDDIKERNNLVVKGYKNTFLTKDEIKPMALFGMLHEQNFLSLMLLSKNTRKLLGEFIVTFHTVNINANLIVIARESVLVNNSDDIEKNHHSNIAILNDHYKQLESFKKQGLYVYNLLIKDLQTMSH